MPEGKHLLFFISTTAVGGAETNVLKIARELQARGYVIFLSFLEDEGPLLSLIDFEVRGKLHTGLYYKQPWAFYKSYRRFIKTEKIEVVFHFGLKVELISRLLAKSFGVQKIISNIRSTDDWRKWYHTLLDRMTASSVDLWVANSGAGKAAFVRREKIPSDKVEVIYNFQEKPVAPTPYITPTGELLKIGVLANILAKKGYFDLLKVSKCLSEKGIKHQFIFAGADKTEGAFFKAIEQQGLQEQFRYLGYISDKAHFFSLFDIFMLPSYLEGMPTVLLEAMCYGRPIVSTNVGGIPEMITHDGNGFMTSPGNIDGLTQGIIKIKKGRGVDYVRNGYERLTQQFGKETLLKKWVEVIESK